MTERKEITVDIHEWDESFTIPLDEFILALSEMAKKVPPGITATVEFDKYGDDYDSSYGELSVFYTRPETDDEYRSRVQYKSRLETEATARELRELARLQAKYQGLNPK